MPKTDKVNYNTSRTNRIEDVYSDIINAQSADDKMEIIIETLSETVIIPDIARAYTFIYNAKTPEIIYDEFPLIVCTDVQKWGFRGYNFHWGELKNYSWNEVAGYLHVVYPEEIEVLKTIPFAKFVNK